MIRFFGFRRPQIAATASLDKGEPTDLFDTQNLSKPPFPTNTTAAIEKIIDDTSSLLPVLLTSTIKTKANEPSAQHKKTEE